MNHCSVVSINCPCALLTYGKRRRERAAGDDGGLVGCRRRLNLEADLVAGAICIFKLHACDNRLPMEALRKIQVFRLWNIDSTYLIAIDIDRWH